MSAAGLVGITRNPGEPYFDNMVVRWLVNIRNVKGEQELYGACKETDRGRRQHLDHFRQLGTLLRRRHGQVSGNFRYCTVYRGEPAGAG